MNRATAHVDESFDQRGHGLFARGFHAHPHVRFVNVRAADLELLHFKSTVAGEDRVEHLLHHMRINEMAPRFDNLVVAPHGSKSTVMSTRDSAGAAASISLG